MERPRMGALLAPRRSRTTPDFRRQGGVREPPPRRGSRSSSGRSERHEHGPPAHPQPVQSPVLNTFTRYDGKSLAEDTVSSPPSFVDVSAGSAPTLALGLCSGHDRCVAIRGLHYLPCLLL